MNLRPQKQKRRIKSVQISQLFGFLDHRIDFFLDDRITILHGENGVGKTTILKMVNNLFSRNLGAIRSIRFSSFSIDFDDNAKLHIERTINKSNKPALSILFTDSAGAQNSVGFPKTRAHVEKSDILEYVERATPYYPIGDGNWRDASDGEIVSEGVLVRRFTRRTRTEARKLSNAADGWLRDVLASVKVYFIETQRLLLLENTPPHEDELDYFDEGVDVRAQVSSYATDMSSLIRKAREESGALAASLDRTFPNRFLRDPNPEGAREEAIRAIYERQSDLRKELMNAGLLDAEEPVSLPERPLERQEVVFLWHYLADIDKKMAVYQHLLPRVKLFQQIIERKKFLNKRMVISKEKGIYFLEKHGESPKRIPLEVLSSGEQHQLVLVYGLLFKAHEMSLVLIDEPEISLHVTWQYKFLDDMIEIAELVNIDFLIATHSPSIIRKRSHLMVPLKG